MRKIVFDVEILDFEFRNSGSISGSACLGHSDSLSSSITHGKRAEATPNPAWHVDC